jgi:hypothetical protein
MPHTTQTRRPPIEPPTLMCPSCGRALSYEYSFIVAFDNKLRDQQWDVYSCRPCCAYFEYRHFTRRLRRVTPT